MGVSTPDVPSRHATSNGMLHNMAVHHLVLVAVTLVVALAITLVAVTHVVIALLAVVVVVTLQTKRMTAAKSAYC